MGKRTAPRRMGERAHERTILIEMLGYYGLLGAVGVGALFLH